MKWIRRIAFGILGLLAAAVVAGSIYEAVARQRAAHAFPPPGALVDIGGRRLQLDCRGAGRPVVVLESGLDPEGSLSWALVHDTLARTTRTCAYSRAGIMWSDASPTAQSGATIAADLHTLLRTAGETGPFVMVGHSLGGPYVMTFTKRYPDSVAGIVFVDASHPDQVRHFEKISRNFRTALPAQVRLASALRWTGVVRLTAPDTANPKLPADVRRAIGTYLPTSLPAVLAESNAMPQSLSDAGALRQLGSRPLVVLTSMAALDQQSIDDLQLTPDQAGAFKDTWKALHDDEASWSTNSAHLIEAQAGHYLQIERPDLVVDAVRRVVTSIRESVSVAR